MNQRDGRVSAWPAGSRGNGHPPPGAGALSTAVVLLSAAHWAILYFHIPVFTWIVWWFWKFSDRPLKALWLAPVLAALSYAAFRWVLRGPTAGIRAVIVLMALGYATQMGFGYMEGRGIEGIRYRMVTSGHSAFARYAIMQDSFSEAVGRYDAKLDEFEKGGLGTWGRSKPPGTLLLYMVTDRLANPGGEGSSAGARLSRLRTLASYLWPLLSYVVLVPLFLFTSRYVGREEGILACALYVVVPSVTLMSLHTDQTFFPLFAMTALYASTAAGEKRSAALWCLSGMWFYLILFTTFSLIFILPLLFLVPLSVSPAGSRPDRLRMLARQCVLFPAGFALTDLVFRQAFSYHMIDRFRGAMQNHVAWKNWTFDLFHVVHSGAINLVEFALWIGLPLTLLAGHSVYRTLKGFEGDTVNLLGLGLAAVVAALYIFGQTQGETARLWLFLVPFVCVLAARSLARLKREGERYLVPLVLAAQWVTILLTKMNQDFY